jgi:tripartite-type tricarboxylate transporter receptor subunit TctC
MYSTTLMLLAGAALALQTIPAAAQTSAQTWPAKPIRAVVPYAAGSTTDIIPRVVFDHLSARLGQPIVVDNKAGAGGTIGTGLVARAEADGYTLLVQSSAHVIAPSLYTGLTYARPATLPE